MPSSADRLLRVSVGQVWPALRSDWSKGGWYRPEMYLPDPATGVHQNAYGSYGLQPGLRARLTHADFPALGSQATPATVTIGPTGISSNIGSLAGLPADRFTINGLQVTLDGIEVVGNLVIAGVQVATLQSQDLSTLIGGSKVQVRSTNNVPTPAAGVYNVAIGPPSARQIITYTGTSTHSTTASGAQTIPDDGSVTGLVVASVAGLDASGVVGCTLSGGSNVPVVYDSISGTTLRWAAGRNTTVVANCGTTNASKTVTLPSRAAAAGLAAGQSISGTNIPGGTTISSVNYVLGSVTLTLSANATGTGTVTITATIVGQTIANGAAVKQAYLTGCTAGSAGVIPYDSDVNVNLDVSNVSNVCAVEPRADGFTEWSTRLGVTVDLNHLPDGSGGYVAPAALTTPDGKVKFTCRNWGTSGQQIKIVIAAGAGGAETVVTTGTNYSRDRTITVTMRSGGSTAGQIAAAVNASGGDAADQLVYATDLGLGGTVAAMVSTPLAGGVDGTLTLPDISGLAASGQIAVLAGMAFTYDSIVGNTLHGLRYVYCNSGVGSYLWPDTVDLGGKALTVGPGTLVEKLLPSTFGAGSSTNMGGVTFQQCTGTPKNVMSRYNSGKQALNIAGCTNLTVSRSVVYKPSGGNVVQYGGGCSNCLVTYSTIWEHPGGGTGSVQAHYDTFDISQTYNDAGLYFDHVFVPVSKGNGNATFSNNPAPVSNIVFRRCLFGLVEPRGSMNAFDLHTCDGVGARDCRWDKTACPDPSGVTLTGGVQAPFGIVNGASTNIVNPSPDPAAVLQGDGTYTITKTPGVDVPDPAAHNCNLWDDATIIAGGSGGKTLYSALETA